MSDSLEARIRKAVDALTRKKLLVGIPSDAKQPSGTGKVPPPLGLIGSLNEFGDELNKGVAGAFTGDLSAPDKAMHAAGLIAQAAVKQRLIEGPFTPLKPGTIYNRQHRKDPPPNKRTAPLIDTRALFNAVNYAVKG